MKMGLVYWWNAECRGKPKCSERNLSQCHFDYHKSHVDWPGIEPVLSPPRCERLVISRSYHGTTRRTPTGLQKIQNQGSSCTRRSANHSFSSEVTHCSHCSVVHFQCKGNESIYLYRPFSRLYFSSPSNQNHQA